VVVTSSTLNKDENDHSPLRTKEGSNIIVSQGAGPERERGRSKSMGRLVDNPAVIMSANFDALQAPNSCFADSTSQDKNSSTVLVQ
jgi:hypothetical protein